VETVSAAWDWARLYLRVTPSNTARVSDESELRRNRKAEEFERVREQDRWRAAQPRPTSVTGRTPSHEDLRREEWERAAAEDADERELRERVIQELKSEGWLSPEAFGDEVARLLQDPAALAEYVDEETLAEIGTVTVERVWAVHLLPPPTFAQPQLRLRAATDLEALLEQLAGSAFDEELLGDIVQEFVLPALKLCIGVLRLESAPVLTWAQNRAVLIEAGAYFGLSERIAKRTPGGGALLERLAHVTTIAGFLFGTPSR